MDVKGVGVEEEELPALFADDIPEKLTKDMLALAHLSDVEQDKDEEMVAGPIRRKRGKKTSKPYKTADEEFQDDMKELEFRTNAWKPFKTTKKS